MKVKSPIKKRSVFRVCYSRERKRWGVLAPGPYSAGVNPLKEARTKAQAVRLGACIARDIRRKKGTITQLAVHGKDGRICFERTYGLDPRRSKG